jgi:hypothetical protein
VQGRYEFKLLAVDVPSYSGGEQRIFLEGGPRIYERGGVLNELRDPFVRVSHMRRQQHAYAPLRAKGVG